MTDPERSEVVAGPPQSSPAVVAAFDFDGTITRRDSLVPFLVALCGARAVSRTAMRYGARSLHDLATGGGRDAVKARMFADLLSGYDAATVASAGRRYADRLALPRHLRSDTLARWHWHQRQGHLTLIISASLDVYLRPLGTVLGATDVIATTLEVGADGRLTGRMLGGNCRGPEKAARLRQWLDDNAPPPGPRVWAYGDSTGDRELLAMADVPHRLGRNHHLPTPPPGIAWLDKVPG